MLLSMALTSFLTGVTEPIEFTFMFLAPLLFLMHAVLTGAAMVLMNALGVRLGFGFSAGFFDYVLNFAQGDAAAVADPGRGWPISRALLRRLPLRDRALRPEDPGPRASSPSARRSPTPPADARRGLRRGARRRRKPAISVDACTTRLRLVVADQARVDERRLRALGARRLRAALAAKACRWCSARLPMRWRWRCARRPDHSRSGAGEDRSSAAVSGVDAGPWLDALGGRDNVLEVRIGIEPGLAARRRRRPVDEAGLAKLGVRMIARPSADTIHLLVGDAEPIAAALQPA